MIEKISIIIDMSASHSDIGQELGESKQFATRDGRGNHLAATQKRKDNRSFILPEGRKEPNCKKITVRIEPSVYERCKFIAGDRVAQLVRDAINLYLESVDKNLL